MKRDRNEGLCNLLCMKTLYFVFNFICWVSLSLTLRQRSCRLWLGRPNYSLFLSQSHSDSLHVFAGHNSGLGTITNPVFALKITGFMSCVKQDVHKFGIASFGCRHDNLFDILNHPRRYSTQHCSHTLGWWRLLKHYSPVQPTI